MGRELYDQYDVVKSTSLRKQQKFLGYDVRDLIDNDEEKSQSGPAIPSQQF